MPSYKFRLLGLQTQNIMKNFRSYLVYVFIISIVSFYSCKSSHSNQIVDKYFDGNWSGSVYQFDIEESWTAELKCDSKKTNI